MIEFNTIYIVGLVLRAKANDSDAFAELYALTYNKVYNYARHYLKDDYLAQDALQETYILALKNINKLNNPAVFISWLNRITFNVCYDMNQKRKINNSQLINTEEFDIIENIAVENTPEYIYQKQEQARTIQQALDKLPFHEKTVIVMRYYNDMTLEEIAACTGTSLSTVKRHLASAKKKLQKQLKE